METAAGDEVPAAVAAWEPEEAMGSPVGYTAFSIYKYSKAADNSVTWTKIVVNDVGHLGGEVLCGVTK